MTNRFFLDKELTQELKAEAVEGGTFVNMEHVAIKGDREIFIVNGKQVKEYLAIDERTK